MGGLKKMIRESDHRGIVGAGIGIDERRTKNKSKKKELSNIELNVKINRIKGPINNQLEKLLYTIIKKQGDLIKIGSNYGLNDFNTGILHEEITNTKEIKKFIERILEISKD
tara:strand:+ start:1611 stop:1946 length:336 start_codon:yes stop_codon:yes gene_type:complete